MQVFVLFSHLFVAVVISEMPAASVAQVGNFVKNVCLQYKTFFFSDTL